MITHSDDTTRLYGAIFAAQADGLFAKESRENAHLHTTYADLTDVLIGIAPALKQHGLAIMQFPGAITIEEGQRFCEIATTIAHPESGQWLTSTMTVPVPNPPVSAKTGNPTANLNQMHGSAISYGRRYALLALLCLSTGDDDDGAALMNAIERSGPPEPSYSDPPTVPAKGSPQREPEQDPEPGPDQEPEPDPFEDQPPTGTRQPWAALTGEIWRTHDAPGYRNTKMGMLTPDQMRDVRSKYALDNPAVTASLADYITSSARLRSIDYRRIKQSLPDLRLPDTMTDCDPSQIVAIARWLAQQPRPKLQ